jgi:superfamily II DNA/RNA helicase
LSSPSFAELGVAADAVRYLRARGIDSAFPIQALAIPPALAGRDICGRAPTGSGKTIAFGLPVAARVPRGGPRRPTALILAPTRELAAQIEKEMALLLGRDGHRRVAAFYGGVGFGPQLKALSRGIDVAVACPGRLKDLIDRGDISLGDVQIVVLDEADRMADMGFLPEVRRLLNQVRDDRQTMLFSATLDGDVDTLIRNYQRDPVHVAVEAEASAGATTTHNWVDVPREERVALTAGYIADHGSTVVFCRTKHGADRLARQLSNAGVSAVPIHGDRSQGQREKALAAFAAGRAQALVATDVAARGIHVDDVRCVVHFDLPATDKDYMHRSGRTGRAGADGTVIAYVTPNTLDLARDLRRALVGVVPAKSSASRDVARPAGTPAPTTPATPAGSDPAPPRTNGSDPSGPIPIARGQGRHPGRRGQGGPKPAGQNGSQSRGQGGQNGSPARPKNGAKAGVGRTGERWTGSKPAAKGGTASGPGPRRAARPRRRPA